MSRKLLIWTVIISALFCFSCSSAGADKADSADAEEVVIDDVHKTNSSNEIFIEDSEFKGAESAATAASNAGSQERAQIAPDGSRITTMYDGFGNKVETRYFDYHPRLKQILVRTFADGTKQAYVYGQSGEVKDLPANFSNTFLTSSADEVANAVGITNIVPQSLTIVQNQKPLNAPLQPMPSYKFPVQNQSAQPSEGEEAENSEQQTAAAPQNTTVKDAEPATQERKDPTALNKKSKEEQ